MTKINFDKICEECRLFFTPACDEPEGSGFSDCNALMKLKSLVQQNKQRNVFPTSEIAERKNALDICDGCKWAEENGLWIDKPCDTCAVTLSNYEPISPVNKQKRR